MSQSKKNHNINISTYYNSRVTGYIALNSETRPPQYPQTASVSPDSTSRHKEPNELPCPKPRLEGAFPQLEYKYHFGSD